MNQSNSNSEREVEVKSGSVMLVLTLALMVGCLALVIGTVVVAQRSGNFVWQALVLGILGEVLGIVLLNGFFTLQPNQARVLILFGSYKGTVKKSGFHWGNPFYSNGSFAAARPRRPRNETEVAETPQLRGLLRRNKISLRARNFNGERLKVNDKRGNPIEIGAVVVWRVADTTQALFDVDDFEHYVTVQSESALRHLATCYAYDHGEDDEITLRSNVDEISRALQAELQERLTKAGVRVEEARLTHLAYAPEIAQAMLRRQQAEAIIAARQKIVQGAVGMVELALKDLAAKNVLHLDDERRAAMVSNLMVVLCGESEVHPIVNAGTLYN